MCVILGLNYSSIEAWTCILVIIFDPPEKAKRCDNETSHFPFPHLETWVKWGFHETTKINQIDHRLI